MITDAVLGDLNGQDLTIRFPQDTIEKLNKFRPGDLCTVEIKRPKDKRSLEQNAYIWKIIDLIDKKINGYCSDKMSIYCALIKAAGIKVDYIQGLEQIRPRLEEVYRVVELVEYRATDKAATALYRCYIGTSQFTKSEMSDFIEVLISRAYEEGIDILMYEDILRGGK
ncbi:MAG: hypothetical protein Q4D77_02410 [Peptostreptococcaceae bacterium]|nr:hypothetical protein [Peptostreptococcaceae bacterium]